MGNCNMCGQPIKHQYQGRNRNRCGSCNTRIRRYLTKKAAITYLGGKCQYCGWKGNQAAFEFHHTNPNKEFEISRISNRSWSVVVKELDKCILLCSNCHRIEHSSKDDPILKEFAKNYKGKLKF